MKNSVVLVPAGLAKKIAGRNEMTLLAATRPRRLREPPGVTLGTSHQAAGNDSVQAVKAISPDLLGEATRRLAEEFHPEEIWLFGSHAWGQPDDDSDVDLMVIVRHSDDRAIRRMQRAHQCLTGIGFPKDVLVPTRADVDRYKHLRASLFHQVLTKGRKLYG